MATKFGVIADDITGALDTAGAFATSGLGAEVQVTLAGQGARAEAAEVVCLNVESRDTGGFAAAAGVEYGWSSLARSGCDRLYLKIDSTLRGSVAVTCGAALEASEADGLLVCPAFPSMGRYVSNGRLRLRGQSTFDGISIVDVLESHRDLHSTSVSAEELRLSGSQVIRDRVSDGFNAIVVDAETESDLELIAQAVVDIAAIVPVGSAGLAYALGRSAGGGHRVATAPRLTDPVLAVSGSFDPVSMDQVATVARSGSARVFRLDPDSGSADWTIARRYASNVRAELRELLESGVSTVLNWPAPSDPEAVDTAIGIKLSGFVGSIVYGMVSKIDSLSLVLVGGQTAYAVLSSIGADRIRIRGEFETGVPIGTIMDGIAAGRQLATKAGGFGDVQTLVRVLGGAV